MDRAPQVSVIVIFLDAERFLDEAVASVRAQTLEDWELLLCDDGSTDGSAAIAEGWALRDRRVRCLHHPGRVNRGMAATRNLGLRHATGRYVALLDADDAWLPMKLEHQIAILERHPDAGMVCGASLYWQSWAPGAVEEQDRVVPVGAPQDALIPPPGLITTLYPLGPGTPPCPSDVVCRKEAIEGVGGFEEHFLGDRQLYEDQGFLSKLYLEHPVYVSGACLGRYRLHPDSCVATVLRSGRYHEVRRYYLEWLGRYLRRERIEDESVLRALQTARRQDRLLAMKRRVPPFVRRMAGPLR